MFSLKVIAVMAAGVLAGRLARKSCCFAFLDKSIFYTVLLLLFWMGVEVGGNPHVTRSPNPVLRNRAGGCLRRRMRRP